MKATATVAAGCAAVLALGLTAAGAAGADAAGWSAGAATVDITPAGPVWMAGYAARKTPSEGVALPLRAKALALRDGGGRTAVWLTADLIGFDRPLTDAVTARVATKHGLPRDAIALFASHTHTGPALKNVARNLTEAGLDPSRSAPNDAYRRGLEDKLVAVVGDALGRLGPASVAYGVGRAGFAMNRREKTPTGFKIGLNPAGPTDKDVPVLRVTDAAGTLRAVVFGYACHNTTLTEKILALSGDYAGFAQEALETGHPGAVALFVTGCAGDANPEPRGTLELARRHGRELADAVDSVLARDGGLQPVSGPLRAAYAETTLRFAGPTDRASYESRLHDPKAGSGRKAHARRLLARIDAGRPVESTYTYPVQAFALGDGPTVLALAGEVVVDYALRLKKELNGPGRDLWVAAYANDVFGYVPSLRVLREGGYEGGEAFYYSTFPTPFADDVEETIARTARAVVARVRGAESRPGGEAPEPKGVKQDRDRLQGTWVAESGEAGGKALSDEQLKFFQLVVNGDKITLGGVELVGYELDPTKTPRTIDFLTLDLPAEGIYKFEGDKLHLSLGGPKARPRTFSSGAGDEHEYLVLKRP